MRTRRYCPHCGKELTKSHIKGYTFQCMDCDEDFYKFEVLHTKDREKIHLLRQHSLFEKHTRSLRAEFNYQKLQLVVIDDREEVLNVSIKNLTEASDYWNSIRLKGLTYDINLYIPEEADGLIDLTAYAVINTHIETSIYFTIPLTTIK